MRHPSAARLQARLAGVSARQLRSGKPRSYYPVLAEVHGWFLTRLQTVVSDPVLQGRCQKALQQCATGGLVGMPPGSPAAAAEAKQGEHEGCRARYSQSARPWS